MNIDKRASSENKDKNPNFQQQSKCGCQFHYKLKDNLWVTEDKHNESCLWNTTMRANYK